MILLKIKTFILKITNFYFQFYILLHGEIIVGKVVTREISDWGCLQQRQNSLMN